MRSTSTRYCSHVPTSRSRWGALRSSRSRLRRMGRSSGSALEGSSRGSWRRGVLWIAGALVYGPARTVLWLAALALDYGAPLVLFWILGRPRPEAPRGTSGPEIGRAHV